MARPIKQRIICSYPAIMEFRPFGSYAETVELSFDEYEVMRLLDTMKYSQEECARQMGLARSTVAAIHESARQKTADSIIYGNALVIHGGDVAACANRSRCCGRCGKSGCAKCKNGSCPECNGKLRLQNECKGYES